MLVIYADGGTATHRLEGPGPVAIGRSRSNQIIIDHPSISRRHAELSWWPLALVDLGSSNGSRVRGAPLVTGQTTALALGETATLGDVSIRVQRAAATARMAQGPGRPLEGRIAEECARAGRARTPFAHLRLHARDVADRAKLGEILATSLRTRDLISEPSAGRFQVLLVDANPVAAGAVVDALRARSRAGKIDVGIGVAHFPGEGVQAEQLSALAWERAEADGSGTAGGQSGSERLVAQIAAIARGQGHVLVSGEAGVGKALAAEGIHRASARAAGPLLGIDCGALGEQAIERELFGPTGAMAAAAGGTLVLRGIGALSSPVQARLALALEAAAKRGAPARDADVRLVATTRRALADDIAGGRFRQDLYFRLSQATLEVPALAGRPRTILALARAFIARACGIAERPLVELTPEAVQALVERDWPGNVRDLRHAIERALVDTGDGPIDVERLDLDGGEDEAAPTMQTVLSSPTRPRS
jgi:hypothetical protein